MCRWRARAPWHACSPDFWGASVAHCDRIGVRSLRRLRRNRLQAIGAGVRCVSCYGACRMLAARGPRDSMQGIHGNSGTVAPHLAARFSSARWPVRRVREVRVVRNWSWLLVVPPLGAHCVHGWSPLHMRSWCCAGSMGAVSHDGGEAGVCFTFAGARGSACCSSFVRHATARRRECRWPSGARRFAGIGRRSASAAAARARILGRAVRRHPSRGR